MKSQLLISPKDKEVTTEIMKEENIKSSKQSNSFLWNLLFFQIYLLSDIIMCIDLGLLLKELSLLEIILSKKKNHNFKWWKEREKVKWKGFSFFKNRKILGSKIVKLAIWLFFFLE